MRKPILTFVALLVVGRASSLSADPIYVQVTFIQHSNGDGFTAPPYADQVITEIVRIPEGPGSSFPTLLDYIPGDSNFTTRLSYSIVNPADFVLQQFDDARPYDRVIISTTPYDVWSGALPALPPGWTAIGGIPTPAVPTLPGDFIIWTPPAEPLAAPLALQVPEPTSFALGAFLLMALAVFQGFRWRRRVA